MLCYTNFFFRKVCAFITIWWIVLVGTCNDLWDKERGELAWKNIHLRILLFWHMTYIVSTEVSTVIIILIDEKNWRYTTCPRGKQLIDTVC